MSLAWKDKDANSLNNMMTQNAIIESPIGCSIGAKFLKGNLKVWFRAFPELSYKENELSIHKNEVLIDWEVKGRHLGEFYSISATGKPIIYQGTTQLVFLHNKVVKYKANVNIQEIIAQLSNPGTTSIFNNKSDDISLIVKQILGVNLTRRQIECLALSTINMTVKEIGALLSIESSSVQTHLQRVFELLDISNKKMFMSYAIEHNVIELLIRIALFLRLDK